MDRTKINLHEDDMPKKWYNIQADLAEPLSAVYSPQTMEPAKPEELAVLFPMEILRQEMSQERYEPIPEEVREILKLWRPSPLYRARRLEEKLKTPAKIYYKWEGVSPPGSHKPNTAIPQAYYNMLEGTERIATETGAGQWGSSLAFATQFFGIECKVYMVRVSYDQKPYRRIMMETWGATCVPSPSPDTQSGRNMLEQDPDCSGSLGLAISEAVEDAATHENTKYSLGSVLNHVCMHQTVIGQESIAQLSEIDLYPDIVIGCVGGGSNFSGLAFPYAGAKLRGKKPDTRIVAVEPTACPTLTKGIYAYDYGDSAKLGPIVKMYTLGHDFMPPGIHAGGLRYHGDSPILSKLVKDGIMEAQAYHQVACFEAAQLFAQTEGFIVAPEAAHAIKAVIEEAKKCKESGEEKIILFNNSGHGHFDLGAYDLYHQGKLVDYEYPEELVKKSLEKLPKVE
ncbi:MAG: TrpB-like pyridoxal phosphate-dependent enzyme [Candidatus Altiarchaeota archaeon]